MEVRPQAGLTLRKIRILAVQPAVARLTSCSMYIQPRGMREAADGKSARGIQVWADGFGKVVTHSDRGLVRMVTGRGSTLANGTRSAYAESGLRFVKGMANLPAYEAVNNSLFVMEPQS